MKLSQLKYFLEVADCLNITSAAKKLYISQPTLTVSIKNLENELGVQLLARSKQRISLTEEGQYFREQLEPLIDSLLNLHQEMLDLGQIEHIIRVGIPPMMGSLMFPKIFSKFISQNPDINFEIKEHGAIKVEKLLLDDALDLSLLLMQSHINKTLNFIPIEKRSLKLYVSKNSDFANKKSVSISQIKDHKLIMFNDEFFTSRLVKDQFKALNIEPNIAIQTTQISTIQHSISQNLGVAILIDGSIPEDHNHLAIPIIDIDPVTIGIAWKKKKYLTSETKKLIQYIKRLEYEN